METPKNLLEVKNLSVSYKVADRHTRIIEDISFNVPLGKCIGLVGESGCGKTTTMRTILGVLASNGTVDKGEILFEGKDIFTMTDSELQRFRQGGAGMIFQDPSSALNPVFSVEQQFMATLEYSNIGKNLSKEQRRSKAIQALKDVSMADPERILDSYPFQLSGGMRQRICIAMTLATEKKLLLADEPTTALDVTIQDQILRLIKKLVEEGKLSVIMVTHSLGVIRYVTTEVNVMYAGTIVERGSTKSVFENPSHPYTQALMVCLPKLTGVGIAEGIPGRVPDYNKMPEGCRFSDRCPFAMERCKKEQPEMRQLEADHWIACFKEA